jgi:hypothetical protein
MYRDRLPARAAQSEPQTFGAANCLGGALSWLPIRGCSWQAGAAPILQAAGSGGAIGENFITGWRYLVRVGREDGITAMLAAASEATIYAAASAAQWTVEELHELLQGVDDRTKRYFAKRQEADTKLAALEAQGLILQAATLRATYRDSAYTAAQTQLVGVIQTIETKLREVGADASSWLKDVRQRTTFGAGPAALPPVLVGTVAAVAIGGACLVAWKLLDWLTAREEEITTRAIADSVTAGKLPASALQEQQERLKKQAAEDAKGLDALGEGLGGLGIGVTVAALVFAFLPLLRASARAGAAEVDRRYVRAA